MVCAHFHAEPKGANMQVSTNRNLVQKKGNVPDSLYMIHCSQTPVECSLRNIDGRKHPTSQAQHKMTPNVSSKDQTVDATDNSFTDGSHSIHGVDAPPTSTVDEEEKRLPGSTMRNGFEEKRQPKATCAMMGVRANSHAAATPQNTEYLIGKRNKLWRMKSELKRLESSVLSMKRSIADLEAEIDHEKGEKDCGIS